MSRITYTVLVETLNNVLSIIKADVTLRRLRQCRRRRLLAALLGLPLCFCCELCPVSMLGIVVTKTLRRLNKLSQP